MAALLAVLPGLAWAQVDRLPKPGATHRQSALNPAGLSNGDNQRRGRMSADLHLGIPNGNVAATQTPYSRMGPSNLSPVQPDIWPFPQATLGAETQFAHNGRYSPLSTNEAAFPSAIVDDQLAAVPIPLAPLPAIPNNVTGAVGYDAAFTVPVPLLSTGAMAPDTGGNGQYHSAPVTAPTIASNRFVWYPRVQGRSGEYRRFAIKVYIPQPYDDPDTNAAPNEVRITDALYRVTYHKPVAPGRFEIVTKDYTVSQAVGGVAYLTNPEDGSRAYIPMVTERSYDAANPTVAGGATVFVDRRTAATGLGTSGRANVTLFTRHANPQPDEVVIADTVEFVQRNYAIYASPTVVGPHGGRKRDIGALPPGTLIQQPAAGPNYTTSPQAAGADIATPNDSFDFAGNPRDPAFNINSTDRSNFSTLYQGPASHVDPRTAANVRTTMVLAENHEAYRNGLAQIPYFSHAQVLIIRTDFLPVLGSGSDGTLTRPVSSIWCIDWATRTPIWRFPDRTHLPATVGIPLSGLRNNRIGVRPNGTNVYQIEDVVGFDGGSVGNPNGVLSDDEIFIDGDFGDAAHGSVSVVPGVQVFGSANIPTYDAANTTMNGIALAPLDRYSRPGAPDRLPIQMPVAYVALPNGTLLALDPFGNNDNRYTENAGDTTQLGTYRNGTTNLLWVFAPESHPRQLTAVAGKPAETFQLYSQRLKREIPVPNGYGASSPVIAWERSDDDTTLNTFNQEPRLFVGNQNGILYALDARAVANGVNGVGVPNRLGFRKGEQIQDPTYPAITYDAGADAEATDHRIELKWWFRTLAGARGGAINAPPSVSTWAHPRPGVPGSVGSKGVYFTTGEGRVYCLDWQGPVTRVDHEVNMTWDGTPGSGAVTNPAINSAAALNDDRWFYTVQVGQDLDNNGVFNSEQYEGTVRPRWAFPNTYQSVRGPILPLKFDYEEPDFSNVYGANRMAFRQAGYAPIEGAVSLVDFPYLDPDSSTLSGIRRYVAVTVNDTDGSRGRLLLLDQIGDRRDFLTSPTPQVAVGVSAPGAPAVPATGSRIVGLPVDQWVNPLPGALMSRATPSWNYRAIYEQYNGTGVPDITLRNAPSLAADPSEPAKRPVPTIYVGGQGYGGKARIYAIDIDQDTGLLVRYRDTGQPQEQALPTDTVIPAPLWNGNAGTTPVPIDMVNPNDPTNPVSPILRVGPKNDYAFNRILARTIALDGDDSGVESLNITGGPLQNRNNSTAKNTADGLPTTPATVGPLVDPTHPSVPLLPTDDAPVLAPVLGNITNFYYNMGAAPPVLPTTDLTARYVNQDIDDPLATSRGGYFDEAAAPAANLPNIAYQYPVLWATTAGNDLRDGSLYELNSNIEGEEGDSTLGWALVEADLDRFNARHIYHLNLYGLGGPGSGAVSMTNAYYEAFDKGYTARRQAWRAKLAGDTSIDYPYYPEQEPQQQASIFNDAPRPHFKPRRFFEGNGGAVPPLATDEHTGQTGFPLDQNGLFYDKGFATDLDPVTPPANNNESGRYRLPGYSQITHPVTGDVAGTGTPMSDNERRAGVVAGQPNDDINNVNPASHFTSWLYVGSARGTLYEITPVFRADLGGVVNGVQPPTRPLQGSDTGIPYAKVDIFNEADYNALLAQANAGTPRRPRRDPGLPLPADAGVTDPNIISRAARGDKNIFEWGQRAYIVVWDVPVVAPSLTVDGVGNPLPAVPTPTTFTVQITVSGQNAPITLNLPATGGAVATYPYVPDYGAGAIPPGFFPSRLGVAFYALEINRLPPGQKLHVSVTGGTNIAHAGNPAYTLTPRSQVGGINALMQRDNVEPDLFVANPLGIQAHLVQTISNFPAAIANNEGKFMNGIGPFRTGNGLGGPTDAANLVADQSASNGSRDPDRANFEFSQALANGNTITRLDMRRYDGSGNLNPNFEKVLKDENGANDASYYVPVAVGLGYGAHGRTASSDVSPNQRNLRIINRSALPALGNIRMRLVRDLNWRWWPATIPNADADAERPGSGANPRQTPGGMGVDGVINPLPWETRPRAASAYAPWRPVDPSEGTQNIGSSVDYPDIPATTTSPQGARNIAITLNGQDITKGPGQINGYLSGSINHPGILNPLVTAGDLTTLNTFAASLSVRVPQYQPANLVAMHSLTSTYRQPSTEDGAFTSGISGPVQLPRRNSVAAPGGAVPNAPRSIQAVNPTTGALINQAAIAPYGYTALAEVWVDLDGDGIRDPNEPYREVEVWMGVPVDMGLTTSTTSDNRPTLLDLGRLPQGFGMQNGLLGYGLNAGAFASGFTPDPLNPLAATTPKHPYQNYFKSMTVLNTGNVNLWNLRASQRVEAPISMGNANPMSGQNFYYFGMKSTQVDDNFGILSVGADPLASMVQPNVMPQIVTSLDAAFDAAWLTKLQTDLPAIVYNNYYAPFNGRHTLKKSLVGSSTGSLLGLPDVPRSNLFAGITAAPARLGVTVPVGTPSGTYESSASNVNDAPPMLAVFEDHDTNLPYSSVPVLNGGLVTTAGPTYGGSSTQDTLNPAPGTRPILAAGGLQNTNVLRMRNLVTNGGGVTTGIYQPFTSPAVEVRLTVGESQLTGLIPDFAYPNPAITDPGLITVFSGTLPGIDRFPLDEILNPLAPGGRASSSLTPTAYRGADGSLNLYYVRSEAPAANQNARGFKLYFTRMQWNSALGTWVANTSGGPLANPQANIGANAGWFSAPVEIGTVPGVQQSNTSPFVLHVAPSSPAATLFWINSVPTAGGAQVDSLMAATLGANGQPNAVGNLVANLDPNFRRYGVRAAFDAGTNTTVAFYYGGPTGRWNLYYIPRAADANGIPNGPVPDANVDRRVERQLELPSAISSASEPSAVFRRMALYNNGNTPVVDVYYTGVLRSTNTPDIFMTRYGIRQGTSGNGTMLQPLVLPTITDEELTQRAQDSAWHAEHIAWNRELGNQPVINIDYGGNVGLYVGPDGSRVLPGGPLVPGSWRWDAASQTLFQNVQRAGGGVLQVLIDTSAGIVRFRGADVPLKARHRVRATYQPQTYRITPDDAGDTGSYLFVDPSPDLPQSQDVAGANTILRRTGNIPPGRIWMLWRKDRADKQAGALYNSVRRVGIDLKALGLMADRESLALRNTANGNSQFGTATDNLVIEMFWLGAWNPVAYDADVKTGKIFVNPLYEGLPIRGRVPVATPPNGGRVFDFGAMPSNADRNRVLSLIEEQASASAFALTQNVNEGQVFGFADWYIQPPIGGARIPSDRDALGNIVDPSLYPGKVWTFWSSPRARTGRVPTAPNTLDSLPRGYDLFWQTLAPQYETRVP